MDYKKLANDIFEQGKDKMEEMEIFIQKSKGIEIKVFNGEIDKYSISESGGLSLRGISNEKMGYAYTEKIDESSIDMLIDEAFENGKYIDSLDKENIFAGSDKYEEVDNYNEGLNPVALGFLTSRIIIKHKKISKRKPDFPPSSTLNLLTINNMPIVIIHKGKK